MFRSLNDSHRATNTKSKIKVKYNANIFTLWEMLQLHPLYSNKLLPLIIFTKLKLINHSPKNQGAILADREEVASLPSQQAVNLQNGAETYLDIQGL